MGLLLVVSTWIKEKVGLMLTQNVKGRVQDYLKSTASEKTKTFFPEK